MKQTKKGLLVAVAGWAMMLFSGVPSAWGVFRKAVCEEYGFAEQQAAFVLNITVAAFGIGCLVGGYLQDKKGSFPASILGSALLSAGFLAAAFVPNKSIWLFYLGFCLPAGLGCAFLYPAVMSCMQQANPDKKGLSTGVAGLGFGLSGIVLTVIKQLTQPIWGVRGSFLTLSAAIAVICIGGSFLMRCPPTQQQKGLAPLQMVKTKNYWLVFLAVAFAAPSVLLFSPQIVELAQDRDLPEKIALWIVAAGAAANAVGRLSIPAISDKIGRKQAAAAAMAALAGLSVWFGSAQGGWFFAGYCFLCFFYSGNAALLPSFCTDLFGMAWTGTNYGLAALGMTAGSLLLIPAMVQILPQGAEHWAAAASCVVSLGCYTALELKSSCKF